MELIIILLIAVEVVIVCFLYLICYEYLVTFVNSASSEMGLNSGIWSQTAPKMSLNSLSRTERLPACCWRTQEAKM